MGPRPPDGRGGVDMGTDGESQAERRKRITAEVDKIDTWTRPRVVAYRRQRDSWKRITYGLLVLSALTAIGAAITAGLSVLLGSVIFAGLSAGLSVINTSLKGPAQISKSEKARTTVSALGGSIDAFRTDMPDLKAEALDERLQQLRKEYEEAKKLPDPSERQLTGAASFLDKIPLSSVPIFQAK